MRKVRTSTWLLLLFQFVVVGILIGTNAAVNAQCANEIDEGIKSLCELKNMALGLFLVMTPLIIIDSYLVKKWWATRNGQSPVKEKVEPPEQLW